MAKRKYWLKLREDYFKSPKIKKLRSVAGGDTYALIYLELQCYSIKNEGIIEFEGIEDNIAEELALILDEDVKNVEVLLGFLERYKLIECVEKDKYALIEAMGAIGSEAECTARVRKMRERKKAEQQQIEQQNKQALQCNGNVTECNELVTSMKHDVTKCNDIYNKNKEIRNKNNIYNNNINVTIDIIYDYIINNNLYYVKADEFYNYYSQRGWKTNADEPITNWQALLVNWNNRSKNRLDEERRNQTKMNERHGYVANSNGVPQPVPLETPKLEPGQVNSFLNTLTQSGKGSNIVKSLTANLAKKKEMG